MTEEQMYRIMMVAGMALAAISGLGTIVLLVMMADDFSPAGLFSILLMAPATVGFGWAAVHFGGRSSGHEKVFESAVEREVLTPTQRKDLRRARGEIVMERALVDIEHERQNIVHNQIESSKDPEKPPHETAWTPPERRKDDWELETRGGYR